MRRSSELRPGDDADRNAGWRILGGLLSGIVALAGALALAEHGRPGYLGEEWVAKTLPFGLAEHPAVLWPLTIIATLLAAALLRVPKRDGR
jgi:hypothetical protein